jgi:hypothetical protein
VILPPLVFPDVTFKCKKDAVVFHQHFCQNFTQYFWLQHCAQHHISAQFFQTMFP